MTDADSRPLVLLLAPRYPRPGDSERSGLVVYAELAARALREQGVAVEVLAFHERDRSRHGVSVEEGITVRRVALRWTPMLSRLLPNLLAGWHLHQLVEHVVGGRDVLAIEVPNLEGIGWATVRGPNRWLRMHSPLWEGHATGEGPRTIRDRWIRWLDRVTARRASNLVTHSRVHGEAMRAECHLGNRPIAVVPHGVPDPGIRDPSSVIPGRILAIGPLWARKGADVLLQGFDHLASRHPAASLTIVGPFPDATIERLAREVAARWPGRVRTPGRLSEAALAEEWNAAEVVVMASRYESFGLVAIEAMARGIPVVVSDAGALPEVGGDAAVTFRSGDPMGLADAVGRLLADETLRRSLAERGRERYLLRYRPEVMGAELLGTFRGAHRGT